MCIVCTHLMTKHTQTNPSHVFFLPPLGLYCLRRTRRPAISAGLLPRWCAPLGPSCLLLLSTLCNCFSDTVY